MKGNKQNMLVTILLPCLNEEKTIRETILEIQQEIQKLDNPSQCEILVVDNKSTDHSLEIAKKAGARVIQEQRRGYGSALQKGIQEAKGEFIIFGDCDRSYRFTYIEEFMETLRKGADLVVGNRLKGNIEKGAMPFLHRYIGTPAISFLGRKLYHLTLSDFNCGLRGLKKESVLKLNLTCTGMEYASEMLIKASKNNLIITEIPIDFYCDQREGKPHLRTFRDGVRHLKVLLNQIKG